MPILGRVSPASTEPTLLYSVPTGKQAVATVSVVNREKNTVNTSIFIRAKDDLAVSAVAVSSSGTGFVDIPAITFVGEATTVAEASVTELILTEFEFSSAGGFYFVGDVLTAELSADETVDIEVIAIDANGVITSAQIADAGTITVIPTGTDIVLTGGNGNNAKLSVASLRFGVKTIEVTAPGNGYKSAPTVTFDDGVSSGSAVSVTVQMTGSTLEDSDALEFNVALGESQVLERTGLVLGAGDCIYVGCDLVDSVNIFVYGIEEIA